MLLSVGGQFNYDSLRQKMEYCEDDLASHGSPRTAERRHVNFPVLSVSAEYPAGQ